MKYEDLRVGDVLMERTDWTWLVLAVERANVRGIVYMRAFSFELDRCFWIPRERWGHVDVVRPEVDPC